MASSPRPLSPHIQIYNLLKITSLTSILHRITGAGLTLAGNGILLWWLLALASGPQAYTVFLSVAHSWIGQFILFGLTWAFWFHLCSGIRHLIWDTGRGLKIETARKSGVWILALSAVMTLATWVLV